ncbi:winged helix-turn-helix domain-containing protein [Nonomuraea jiangxiensis]|uniref:Transcriptional regulatory protein, C terminal n=1 Tax=Nonomuraea jiangxiensis TaxID=633440 RepID=A0A1G8BUW6_9ACTN|nr:winged helix-turn-helix domain-containing protein [Nonomuraea jiangxiensis]SDH36951.1 Transcriptional regulatory protein, C terminal [Nonomuraea jiangxiensis]
MQHVGPLAIDRRTRQVHLAGDAVALTPKEFDLLAYLPTDAGAVYSRQQILDEVWDPHFFGPTKTLDAHIAALRRKLGDTAWIATVRGVGFRLVDPTAETPTSPAADRPGAVPR